MLRPTTPVFTQSAVRPTSNPSRSSPTVPLANSSESNLGLSCRRLSGQTLASVRPHQHFNKTLLNTCPKHLARPPHISRRALFHKMCFLSLTPDTSDQLTRRKASSSSHRLFCTGGSAHLGLERLRPFQPPRVTRR